MITNLMQALEFICRELGVHHDSIASARGDMCDIKTIAQQFNLLTQPITADLNQTCRPNRYIYPLLIQMKNTNEWLVILTRSGHVYVCRPMQNIMEKVSHDAMANLIKASRAMYQCFPVIQNMNPIKFYFANCLRSRMCYAILYLLWLSCLNAIIALLITISVTWLLTHSALLSINTYLIAILALVLLAIADAITNRHLHAQINRIVIDCHLKVLPPLFNRILRAPLHATKHYASTDLAQRLFDMEKALQPLVLTLTQCVNNGLAVLILSCYMLYLNVQSSLIYLLTLLLAFCCKCFFYQKIKNLVQEKMRRLTRQQGFLADILLQIAKIRSAAYEQWVINSWWVLEKKIKTIDRRLSQYGITNTFIDGFSLQLFFIIVCVAAVRLTTMKSRLALLSFVFCATQLNIYFEGLMNATINLIMQLPTISRINTLASLLPEDKLPAITTTDDYHNIAISFDNVCYAVNSKLILKNISMELSPGSFVGIVGPSGAGKSTLLNLLLGFETPTAGRILINKRNLTFINLSNLRRYFGVVLQTTNILPGSIYSNISANTSMTLAEAWTLAEKIGLAQDIEQMPMQMFTRLSENAGESISGGQIQKILLARALSTQPSVLLLDEATSALDNHSQTIIYDYLNQLNITRLVIAHRYSTLKNADAIYKIENGAMQRVGKYQQLINSA